MTNLQNAMRKLDDLRDALSKVKGPGSSLVAYLQREAPRRESTVYVIKTTPEQDAAALAELRIEHVDVRLDAVEKRVTP